MRTKAIWFIFGPNGAICQDYDGDVFAHTKRIKSIQKFTSPFLAYGGKTTETVWADFKRIGYTCRRVYVPMDKQQ